MKHHLYEQRNDTSWGKLVLYKCKYYGHSDISSNAIKEHVKNVHEIKMGKMYLKYFFTNRGKGVKLRWRMLLINVSIGKVLILVFRTDEQILSNHYRIK